MLGRLQSGGSATPGGTILFSSPGGIIVGAGALFDVGSLVLTTLNVVDDGAGNFITPGGGFQFNLGQRLPQRRHHHRSGLADRRVAPRTPTSPWSRR